MRRSWMVFVLVAAGCFDAPVERPVNRVTQATPIRVPQNAQNKVDILFMVDNSPSMDAMQSELKARFGDFFKVFQDLAAKGTFADLHIGVVTSDYGAGRGDMAGGCDPSPGGQRGILQASNGGCAGPSGKRYIEYRFGENGATGNVTDLVGAFTCMASVGSKGCGFEHQLESVYAALHNTVENAGFLRDDALLVIVFVTNEDDGSAPPDTDIYSRAATQYGYFDTYRQTQFAIQCGAPPMAPPYGTSNGPLSQCAPAAPPLGKAFDVQRYIDLFTRPRAQGGVKVNPDDVILVGIDAPTAPVEIILAQSGTGNGRAPNPAYVRCNALSPPACFVALEHSCQNRRQPEFFGDPAVRINAVVSAARIHQITSICGDDLDAPPDYSGAMQGLAKLISSQIGEGCIPAKVDDPTAPVCDVEDMTALADGTVRLAPIPRCTSPVTTHPCWRVEVKPQCADLSPQSIGVTIDRNGMDAPPNTTARVECDTIATGPSGLI